ncbi:MAG: ribonuclease, partial [Alphaproteobacteria bacterium]|nr:ribonuclease [Alphaproteobacteria bacterium]
MTKRMLVDATHAEETRVAVVDGTKLVEYDYESKVRKQLKGSIFLAKITRVEPSLQAAFINFGGNRHAFLPFSEIHPDYFRIPIADREALIAEQKAEMEARLAEEAAEEEAEGQVPAKNADDEDEEDDEDDEDDEDEDEDEVEEIGGVELANGNEAAEAEDDSDEDDGDDTPKVIEHPPIVDAAPVAVPTDDVVHGIEGHGDLTVDADDEDESEESDESDEEMTIEGEAVEIPATFDGPEGALVDGTVDGAEGASNENNAEGEEGKEDGEGRNRGGRGRGGRSRGGRSRGGRDRGGRGHNGSSGRRAAADSQRVEIIGGDGVEGDHPIRPSMRRNYKIQEVIKRGQIMLI